MREEHDSIDTVVVDHPKGLQIIIERVSNKNGIRVDEGVQGFTNGCQSQHRLCMVFGCYSREPGDIVAGSKIGRYVQLRGN